MYFFKHNLSIIGCLESIIVVLTSTGFRPSAGRNVFLTSFSLFRRAMNRTSWALQACAEVCACNRTPLRERLAYSKCITVAVDTSQMYASHTQLV